MTQFELFCVVFHALDAVWWKTGGEEFYNSGYKNNEVQNEDLGQFLSEANPFLWKEISSADPAIFSEFCEIVQQKDIPIADSYDVASAYISAMPYYYASAVREAFNTITREEWFDGVKRYMSMPHKGQESC